MFRYLAFMWNEASEDESGFVMGMARRLRSRSSSWKLEFEADGLHVWVADASRHLCAQHLHGYAGLVVGEILKGRTDELSETAVSRAVFGERETQDVIDSDGRVLTSSYWGNFVAFVRDPRARSTFVVNDPAGTLPCHFTEHRGVRLFFSCLPDCLGLGFKRFAVDTAFVLRRAVNGMCDVETEPLTGIARLHRGECMRFDHSSARVARSFHWHPEKFARASEGIDDPELALRTLRATVRSCVRSLAAGHYRVLQQTSGGLDSSIVLGCLGEVADRPDITCYTQYLPDSACDERRWARLAARRGLHPHVELNSGTADVPFKEMPALERSVDPPCCLTHWQRNPMERRLAAERGATAIFTGENGDAAFCSTSYVLAVDHSMRRFGFGRRTWATALMVAARRDRTLWNVAAAALRRQTMGSSMGEHRRRMSKMLQLVSPAAVQSASAAEHDHFPHPWFSASGRMPLESVTRLGLLAYAPTFYDLSTSHLEPAPYTVSPLSAQPVFEVCRRIPVDIHFDHGRIRGLARRAFAGVVPEPILQRQWKDRPPAQAGDLVRRNLDFIRQVLLDGDMVKQHILARDALELALRAGPTRSVAVSGEILNHLDLELWIQRSR
jgi:asparagine synthase (glutamine-hydrolysing)